MIILVNGGHASEFPAEIDAMHRLRAKVFSDRLGWDVRVQDGRERDEFDSLEPDYLIQRSVTGDVIGCVRMLPSLGPNMLRDVFPQLAPGGVPALPGAWEASRYCIDADAGAATARGLRHATFELFAGMVEFGLHRGLTEVLAVVDLRMEKILSRAGWPLDRFAPPQQVGVTQAVAGVLEVSRASLQAIRARGGISGPVLWMPFADQQEAA